MALLDRVRSTILGDAGSPAVYRCRDCSASFTRPRGLDPDEVECTFCGSTNVRRQG